MSLPADILSEFLKHTIQVCFESNVSHCAPAPQLTYEQIVTWCNTHCEHVFSIQKATINTTFVRFYLESDLIRFEKYLEQHIAKSA